MGASRDDFVKYPRTPHLFGSRGTDDDKHLSPRESATFAADPSLIVEEKLDGTNVGIHFAATGRLVLQCRGHEITSGMHAQYDLFKQWTTGKRPVLEAMLQDRFILFGEWLYARHSVHYRKLPHFFFEFDIYDKYDGYFLDLESRLVLLDGTGVLTVPVLHRGAATEDELRERVGPSRFGSAFDNPITGRNCREHLRAGRNFAFNATNTMRQTRKRWIDLFADYSARIEIVYLEPRLDVLFQQNERRKTRVPRQVMDRLVKKLEPPTLSEAHAVELVG